VSGRSEEERHRAYWRANLRYVGLLLSIWFTVGLLFSVLLVDQLDRIPFFGFKLGFWFAQQGAIYTFVVLIFAYVLLMNRLDDAYEREEAEAKAKAAGEATPDADDGGAPGAEARDEGGAA